MREGVRMNLREARGFIHRRADGVERRLAPDEFVIRADGIGFPGLVLEPGDSLIIEATIETSD